MDAYPWCAQPDAELLLALEHRELWLRVYARQVAHITAERDAIRQELWRRGIAPPIDYP